MGASAVAILGTGMGPVFIELLPVKLGMGKSLGGAFGFCCTHVTTVGIKLVKQPPYQIYRQRLSQLWSQLLLSPSPAPPSRR